MVPKSHFKGRQTRLGRPAWPADPSVPLQIRHSQPRRSETSVLSGKWRCAIRGRSRLPPAALLTASGATLAIPSGFKLVIDRGFVGGGGDISRWFNYLLLIVVVLALATAVRFYFVSWLGERVVADMRMAAHANLLRQEPAFFEANRPSEIASRMTSDTAIIEQIVGSTVSIALRNVLTGIGGVIYMFTLAPGLAALLVFGIPIVLTPVILVGRRLRALARTSQDRLAAVGTLTAEVLGAMKIVQAFVQEPREAARFREAVDENFRTARKRFVVRAFMTAAMMFLIFGSITLILWRGALDVVAGTMTGGSIAAFVLTSGVVAGAFGALTEVYGDLLRGAGAASRLSSSPVSCPASARRKRGGDPSGPQGASRL